MMVLITYDVSTETEEGRKRLRQVSKKCEDYGQRVQKSVFECIIDPARLRKLQAALKDTIDPKTDSLRYYYLGDESRHRVDHVGAKPSLDLEGILFS